MWLGQSGKAGESELEQGKIGFAFNLRLNEKVARDFQESCSKVMQNELLFVSQIKPSNKTLDWCSILIFFDPFWLIIPHF